MCRYSLVFFFFFNGLSFHLSAAFASHLLGFKMTWGSTTKEIADTNFFKEVSLVQQCLIYTLQCFWCTQGAMPASRCATEPYRAFPTPRLHSYLQCTNNEALCRAG